jgi:hypothetical protein
MAKNQSTKKRSQKTRGGATIADSYKRDYRNTVKALESNKFLKFVDGAMRAFEKVFPAGREKVTYEGFSNPYNPGRGKGRGMKKHSKRR